MFKEKVFIKFGNGLTITNKEVIYKTYVVGDDDLDLDPYRGTNGKLWRNRVTIAPSVEFQLAPLGEDKMNKIMTYCRQEKFTMTFWYPALKGYFVGEFYLPSNYRKPKLRTANPKVTFDFHDVKFIGMHNMRRTEL